MTEERTTRALPIEEINQLTKILVDTMADGTPKEIAKGLESQFVDRSTEHLYRKVMPTDQSGSTEVYKYVKSEIESAFIPTRRDMKLSFPPTCYSSNDPITLLYESNYKLIHYWTLAILENEDIIGKLGQAVDSADQIPLFRLIGIFGVIHQATEIFFIRVLGLFGIGSIIQSILDRPMHRPY